MTLRAISTDAAPTPAGHYAQAIVHDGLVHLAGQLALDPATGAVVGGDDAALQAAQVLRNLAAVLDAAGSGLDLVLSVHVFVVSRDDWPGVNAACAAAFGAHRPARAIVGGAELKPGCRVEMTAVAAVRRK